MFDVEKDEMMMMTRWKLFLFSLVVFCSACRPSGLMNGELRENLQEWRQLAVTHECPGSVTSHFNKLIVPSIHRAWVTMTTSQNGVREFWKSGGSALLVVTAADVKLLPSDVVAIVVTAVVELSYVAASTAAVAELVYRRR